MLESSFILLRDIGSIAVATNEEIRFTLDAYHGFRYVSIRRYIQTDDFSGATRDGVTLTPEIVLALTPRVEALAKNLKAVTPGQLGKFAKRPGICIVASVGEFKGRFGLDLRQWQQDTGWTKKGIWIPLEFLPQVNELLRQTCAILQDTPSDDF